MREEAVDSRNSPLREITQKGRRWLVERVHEIAPDLHPNDLTRGRAKVFFVGGLWAYFRRGWGPAVSMGGAASTDALDGELHRLLEEKDPNYKNPTGWFEDNKADRDEEKVGSGFRALKAFKEGDRLRAFLALGEMVTNPLTSLFRKLAESKGVEVAEFPKGQKHTLPIRVLGNHGGRMVKEALLAAVDNRYFEIGLSALQIVGNIYTTVDRIRTLRNGKRKELSDEVRQDEREKLNYLLSVTGKTLVTAGEVYLLGRLFDRDRRYSF